MAQLPGESWNAFLRRTGAPTSTPNPVTTGWQPTTATTATAAPPAQQQQAAYGLRANPQASAVYTSGQYVTGGPRRRNSRRANRKSRRANRKNRKNTMRRRR